MVIGTILRARRTSAIRQSPDFFEPQFARIIHSSPIYDHLQGDSQMLAKPSPTPCPKLFPRCYFMVGQGDDMTQTTDFPVRKSAHYFSFYLLPGTLLASSLLDGPLLTGAPNLSINVPSLGLHTQGGGR